MNLHIILFLTIKFVEASLDYSLIENYFKWKQINRIIFLICDHKQFEFIYANISFNNNIYLLIRSLNNISALEAEEFVSKYEQQGFVLDANCENSTQLLHLFAKYELFFDKYKWLIFHKNKTILRKLKNLNMNVNAEVTIAFSKKLNWQLFDVYNSGYKQGGTLKINNLGTWNTGTGFKFNKTMDLAKYVRRKDLSDLNLTGIVVLVDSFPGELLDYLYNNEDNKTVDNFSRYYFILFTHVKDLHNFTLSVQLTKLYGAESSNGSFSGLVGALQRKEADVGLTSIYYKNDRVPHVDFLIPTYLMKTRFLFRHPKPALTIRGSFFSPLSNTVWLSTWGIMLITGFIIRVIFKQEWKLERLRNDPDNYTEYDWSFIALLIFGGICQQDVPRVPNLYSGRTIVFVSVLFTYMLYQFYSGGIVSSLLSEPPTTIKNLQDLLESSLEIGVEDIVYERDYFDQTTDPVAIDLYRKKIVGKKNGSDAFYDSETGMELVKQGGFAFQIDTSTGYGVIAKEFPNDIICELGEVKLYPNQYMTGVVQQDSPFREIFIYSFQRMAEAGLVHRQRIRWTTRKSECIKIVDSSSIFVGIKEFFPALLFYSVGIIISLIIFKMEILIHRKIQNKRKL